MSETEIIIKKYLKSKRIKDTVCVIIAFLAVISTIEFTVGIVNGQPRVIDIAPAWASVLLFVFAVVFPAIWTLKEHYKIYKICDVECNPQKFNMVFRETIAKESGSLEILNKSMAASFLMGDFYSCMNYSIQALKKWGKKAKKSAYVNRCRSAYFMNDIEFFKTSYEELKKTVDLNDPKDRYLLQFEFMSILNALIDQDAEKAAAIADSIDSRLYANVIDLQRNYYKGMAYFAAGRKYRAIQCFLNAKDKAGTTIFSQKCEEYLEKLS